MTHHWPIGEVEPSRNLSWTEPIKQIYKDQNVRPILLIFFNLLIFFIIIIIIYLILFCFCFYKNCWLNLRKLEKTKKEFIQAIDAISKIIRPLSIELDYFLWKVFSNFLHIDSWCGRARILRISKIFEFGFIKNLRSFCLGLLYFYSIIIWFSINFIVF